MIERDWHNCYGESWNGQITSDAFAHPAKFARGLIRRIYQHALEQEYLQSGETVLDPFGGVGLGGLDAISLGLNWLGVELEEKFVKLGADNIALWEHQRRGQRHFDNLPELGKAILLQGDSCYLCDVLGEAGGVVSSPPYSSRTVHGNHGLHLDKFKEPGRVGKTSHALGEREMSEYGTTPGQLGAMRVVSSPLYAESMDHAPGNKSWEEKPTETQARHGNAGYSGQVQKTTDYGQSAGQLGRMRVVSSPPYSHPGEQPCASQSQAIKDYHTFTRGSGTKLDHQMDTIGNLGQETANDFWQAARQIMEQVAMVLPPGAVAIWVCKGFIRKGEYIDFPQQWRQLGEACGFETLEWIRAWLVEDRGTQYDLFGGEEHRTVARKSFFRRLAESKGSPPIDYEIVLIQAKC